MDEPWKLTAVEIAAAVTARQLSCREVVESHVARIEAVNGAVNAVTRVLADEALSMADVQDRAIANGAQPGPLAGVPFTVKENIDLEGSPTTMGVEALAGDLPTGDAPHVAQLKAAGAIPIGRTNLPDFALRWHTDNQLHGLTLNPWDPRLTAGGSSGGDAAALATGMTPLGLGNDIAGSLRWPSQCCGTAAIKPTRGRVARTRMTDRPVPRGMASQMFAVHGPMARHAGDLWRALACMSGPSPTDPWWTPAPLEWPRPEEPVRVAVCVDPDGQGVDPGVAEAVRAAAEALADGGFAVDEVQLPSIERATEVYYQLLGDLTAASDPAMVSETFERYRAAFAGAYDIVAGEPSDDGWSDRLIVAREWSEFMERVPLIVAPVATMQPWPLGYDEAGTGQAVEWLRAIRMVVLVNFLGLPAASVPTGLRDGVPQGVQVIGPAFREDLCIAAAEAIEERLGRITPIDPVRG